MKLVFLATSASDLAWIRSDYAAAFPQGRDNAQSHFKNARLALLANPQLGNPLEKMQQLRELTIVRTLFSLVYYLVFSIAEQEIRIIRIWDGRSKRPPEWS